MLAMTVKNHDTLVRRLAMMLVKLNQGESLDPLKLTEEFGVTLRTIQRDINQRFGYLPLEKSDGKYRMAPAFLGRLTLKDVERFASLAGIGGLFPSLSTEYLREIFDNRIESALMVKGHHYEDLAGKESVFRGLEQAIIARQTISFSYRKDDGGKNYSGIEPYKLLNQKGIWYLAGKDSGKLKTFSFAKIERLMVLDETFVIDPTVDKTLIDEDGIWLGEAKIELVLKISKDVADYFKRRKLIANQVIEKELSDGGLIVSCKVGHPNQVMPIVRYWIPHLRVISPEGLQAELELQLTGYVQGNALGSYA